jgi:hypothetical protein
MFALMRHQAVSPAFELNQLPSIKKYERNQVHEERDGLGKTD